MNNQINLVIEHRNFKHWLAEHPEHVPLVQSIDLRRIVGEACQYLLDYSFYDPTLKQMESATALTLLAPYRLQRSPVLGDYLRELIVDRQLHYLTLYKIIGEMCYTTYLDIEQHLNHHISHAGIGLELLDYDIKHTTIDYSIVEIYHYGYRHPTPYTSQPTLYTKRTL